MSQKSYAIVGFVLVGILASVSLLVGGQNQNIFGHEIFFPIMSVVATLLAFTVPEGNWLLFNTTLCFAMIFLAQFLLVSWNRTLFRIWNLALIGLVSLLAIFQALEGWNFAVSYYGFGITVFCMLQSVAIISSMWVTSYFEIRNGSFLLLLRSNLLLFCGLAWGAFPYLGELP